VKGSHGYLSREQSKAVIEKLKSRPATANFSSVLMASKSDIAAMWFHCAPRRAAKCFATQP